MYFLKNPIQLLLKTFLHIVQIIQCNYFLYKFIRYIFYPQIDNFLKGPIFLQKVLVSKFFCFHYIHFFLNSGTFSFFLSEHYCKKLLSVVCFQYRQSIYQRIYHTHLKPFNTVNKISKQKGNTSKATKLLLHNTCITITPGFIYSCTSTAAQKEFSRRGQLCESFDTFR